MTERIPWEALPKSNPFKPDLATLVKLGSIAVHTDELLSRDGHAYDRVALQSLLADPDVQAWIKAMDAQGFLPKKRER